MHKSSIIFFSFIYHSVSVFAIPSVPARQTLYSFHYSAKQSYRSQSPHTITRSAYGNNPGTNNS